MSLDPVRRDPVRRDPVRRETVAPLPVGDIVVALDRDAASYGLLLRAVAVAGGRARRLRLVHVVREIDWLLDPRPVRALTEAGQRRGQGLLDDAVDVVAHLDRDVEVCTRLFSGSLHESLLAQAATAGLVILGAGRVHGPGLCAGPGDWLRHHSAVPVLVLGGAPRQVVRRAVGSRR